MRDEGGTLKKARENLGWAQGELTDGLVLGRNKRLAFYYCMNFISSPQYTEIRQSLNTLWLNALSRFIGSDPDASPGILHGLGLRTGHSEEQECGEDGSGVPGFIRLTTITMRVA